MLADGLLAEVREPAARPGGLSRTAAQALGYKELLEHRAVAARSRRRRRRSSRGPVVSPPASSAGSGVIPGIRWVDVDNDPSSLDELERALA